MPVRIWAGTMLAMVLAAGMMAAGSAQEVVRSPAEIQSCLCKEQSVSTLANDVLTQNHTYEEKRKALEALDNEVRTRRAQVNVSNPGEVDSFKQLLDQRDKAADAFAGEVTRSYADAVTRYNEAVAAFNASCAGKAYEPDQLAEVRRNLSCPKP